MVWARGGKAELGLTSLKALSACGENRARRKAEGTPEEALQHPGERGLDQEGCQKLRMGVCFGTMADRIADGLYVWDEREAFSPAALRPLPAAPGCTGEVSPFHPGLGGGTFGKKMRRSLLQKPPRSLDSYLLTYTETGAKQAPWGRGSNDPGNVAKTHHHHGTLDHLATLTLRGDLQASATSASYCANQVFNLGGFPPPPY